MYIEQEEPQRLNLPSGNHAEKAEFRFGTFGNFYLIRSRSALNERFYNGDERFNAVYVLFYRVRKEFRNDLLMSVPLKAFDEVEQSVVRFDFVFVGHHQLVDFQRGFLRDDR